MAECVHHWLLEDPSSTGTPSVCLKCGDEKTWPRSNYQALADGRPFLLKDPLLPRLYNTGYGGPRPQDYWN